MKTQSERYKLKHIYFSKAWSKKVDAMTDRQVKAMIRRFKEKGILS